MLTRVFGQVDQLYGYANGFEHCLPKGLGFAHYGHDETVVILIVAIVQQLDAFARAEGVYYLFDFLFVAAFREVGHALHDS